MFLLPLKGDKKHFDWCVLNTVLATVSVIYSGMKLLKLVQDFQTPSLSYLICCQTVQVGEQFQSATTQFLLLQSKSKINRQILTNVNKL